MLSRNGSKKSAHVAALFALAASTLAAPSYATAPTKTDAMNGTCSAGGYFQDTWGVTSKFQTFRKVSGTSYWDHHAQTSPVAQDNRMTLESTGMERVRTYIFDKYAQPIETYADGEDVWVSTDAFRGSAVAIGWVKSLDSTLAYYSYSANPTHLRNESYSVPAFQKTFASGDYSVDLGIFSVGLSGSVVGSVSGKTMAYASYGAFDANHNRTDRVAITAGSTASLDGKFKLGGGIPDLASVGMKGSISFIRFGATVTGTTENAVSPYAYGGIDKYNAWSSGVENLSTLDGSLSVYGSLLGLSASKEIYSWNGISVSNRTLFSETEADTLASVNGFAPAG